MCVIRILKRARGLEPKFFLSHMDRAPKLKIKNGRCVLFAYFSSPGGEKDENDEIGDWLLSCRSHWESAGLSFVRQFFSAAVRWEV